MEFLMYRELAISLKEEKRFKEALAIVEEFSEDSENVIIFAIECGQYKTAMKLCTKFKHLYLIGTLFLRENHYF